MALALLQIDASNGFRPARGSNIQYIIENIP
jgi:hypothetical protein